MMIEVTFNAHHRARKNNQVTKIPRIYKAILSKKSKVGVITLPLELWFKKQHNGDIKTDTCANEIALNIPEINQAQNLNHIQKQPNRHTLNNISPNTWVPHNPVKLTHKSDYHTAKKTPTIYQEVKATKITRKISYLTNFQVPYLFHYYKKLIDVLWLQ